MPETAVMPDRDPHGGLRQRRQRRGTRAPTIDQTHMPAFLAGLAYPPMHPANTPLSPRMDARRRIMTSIFASMGSHGHRAGTGNPTGLGLSNGMSTGVTPNSGLPAGSSSEEDMGRLAPPCVADKVAD